MSHGSMLWSYPRLWGLRSWVPWLSLMSFVPLAYFLRQNSNLSLKWDIHYGCTKSPCKNTMILSAQNMHNTILSVYVTWDFSHSHYFGVKLRKTKLFTDLLCGIDDVVLKYFSFYHLKELIWAYSLYGATLGEFLCRIQIWP